LPVAPEMKGQLVSWNIPDGSTNVQLVKQFVTIKNPDECPTNRSLANVLCVEDSENPKAEHVVTKNNYCCKKNDLKK